MTRSGQTITSFQFFTLLFAGRAALTILYSSGMSGMESLWDFMLPLLIMLPVGLLMLAPTLILSSGHSAATPERGPAIKNRPVLLLYGTYYLYSALYFIAVFLGFLRDALPEGVEPKVIIVLLILSCTYAGTKGIESAARTAFVVLVIIILSAALTAVFVYPSYSPENLPPMQKSGFDPVIDGAFFLISRLGLCSCMNVVSDSIRPAPPSDRLALFRSAAVWLSISTTVMLALTVLFTGAAGDYLGTKKFQIFRITDCSGVLQKSEPLFMTAAACTCFCGTALLIISASRAFGRAFVRTGEKRSALISGGVLIAAVLLTPEDILTLTAENKPLSVISAVLFVTVIPLMTLVFRRITMKRPAVFSGIRHGAGTACIAVVLLFVGFLSGCGSLQLNQRIIVQGIGIDTESGQCRLTLITLNTSRPEQDNSVSLMYCEGSSVEQAVDDLERNRGRRLLLEHCLFVMMDESAARDGTDVTGYLISSNDMPKTANLLVSTQSAEETIRTAVEDYGYTSEDISLLTDSSAVKGSIPHCSLMELVSAGRKGGSIELPRVNIDTRSKSLRVM